MSQQEEALGKTQDMLKERCHPGGLEMSWEFPGFGAPTEGVVLASQVTTVK